MAVLDSVTHNFFWLDCLQMLSGMVISPKCKNTEKPVYDITRKRRVIMSGFIEVKMK